MRIHAAVPQNYMQLIKAGMSATLSVAELGDKSYPGKVVRSAGAFDPATRTMVVEIIVPNADGTLVPGMYGQIKFKLENPQPYLIVPVTAVMIGGEGVRVATLDTADTVHFKKFAWAATSARRSRWSRASRTRSGVINNPRDNLEEGVHVKAILQGQARRQEGGEERKTRKIPPRRRRPTKQVLSFA
jgi:multidrug efflux pump subunit AcrA (membrane-fusion protein)